MEFNGQIREDGRKLIQAVTRRKKVSEERVNQVIHQFKDCLDYVTEHEVRKSIESLQHKFVIHAEYEKSRQFRALVDKFLDLAKPKGLTHPAWSILHLLFRLAYRPTDKSTYHFVECQQILEENEKDSEQTYQEMFDWGKYLLEGIKLPQLPKTDDVWSDSEEEAETIRNETVKDETTQWSMERIPLFDKTPKPQITPLTLKDMMQENYWEHPENTVWTEYQVLHEILWALQSKDGTSLLFEKSHGDEITVRSIGMVSLSALGLIEHVSSYIPLLKALKHLNNFISDVLTASQDTYTLTHQAYTACLHSTVIEFYQTLSEFERRLVGQKVTTTLKDLREYVTNWMSILPHLSEVHSKITQVPATAANHVKASRLLSILFTSCQEAQIISYSTHYPVLLRVFLATLRPFLNIVDHWLTEGEIVDYFQEFIITRNESITPQDENFWHNALVRKTGQDHMQFLERVIEHVLLAGRSVELLSHVGHLSDVARQLRYSCPHLYDDFIRRFNHYAESDMTASDITTNDPATKQEETLEVAQMSIDTSQLDFDCDNPLLAAACIAIYSGDNQPAEKGQTPQQLLTPSEFYPLLPLVEQSLMEPIRIKQNQVCRALLDVWNDRCCLQTHMRNLRGIHLMRDGDLMGRFCVELFRKIESADEWRSETCLTLSLINSVSFRLPDASSCVSVSFTNCNRETADLSHLQVNYAVPWPVNLVIGKEMLILYNSVFRFLLQMKRSLISLQRLSFKEISSMDNNAGGVEETLTVSVRQHRLQLLRAWLLHFVGSLDYYIMECVLESAHINLDRKLAEAVHLGQIIEAHHSYISTIYSQCLQQQSAAFLRDALTEVLAVSLEVASAWTKGITSRRLCQLEESYVRYHQYVASVLGTDAAHSMLPFVETLAAALIHSCPTTDKK